MIELTEKENLLNQKAYAIWFTGLSGSGKTTLAIALDRALRERGFHTQIIDGDQLRKGLNRDLGFSESDRRENIRRAAELSCLFLKNGTICINSFISPTVKIRKLAKDIIGASKYIEIHLNTSLATCEKRDVKGLYKLARAGEILNFTGLDATYEQPSSPTLRISTDACSVAESLEEILNVVLPKISLSEK
jgi:adenylylsulfate kinase